MYRFNDDPKKLDAVLYVGGGAVLMGESLNQQYESNGNEIGDEFTIARGILKRMMFEQRKGA